jgi:hypothetical protein
MSDLSYIINIASIMPHDIYSFFSMLEACDQETILYILHCKTCGALIITGNDNEGDIEPQSSRRGREVFPEAIDHIQAKHSGAATDFRIGVVPDWGNIPEFHGAELHCTSIEP